MANVINKATNKFTKGLILDFSPENTGNEVLTHALNATLLTFNGNEMSLQNDMGNARVETAFLPEGYIPVGTCEFGGIIYIVSYNPLEDKSLIGCFPSPERNISSDELGMPTLMISNSDFVDSDGNIENVSKYVLLKNDKLNPGDKFIVTADKSIYNNHLQDLWVKTENDYVLKENPILKLSVVSIEDSGKIIYLNSDIKKYEVDLNINTYYKYHILGTDLSNSETVQQDIDEYRNVLSSGYSVFKSKTSGKLAILAELVMIDEYSVTHSIEPVEDSTGEFDIIIHTDVSPQFTENIILSFNNQSRAIDTPDIPITLKTTSNYDQIPKLKYYYLEESNFYAETKDGIVNLYNEDGSNGFENLPLGSLYVSQNTDFGKILLSTEHSFPKSKTYHGRLNLYTEPIDKSLPSNVVTKFYANKKHCVLKNQIASLSEYNFDYYGILPGGSLDYQLLTPEQLNDLNNTTMIYIISSKDVYIPYDKFSPNSSNNNIEGYDSHEIGDPISLYTVSDGFIPGNDPSDSNTYLKYESLKLGNIKFPEELKNYSYYGKYSYKIVPCMEYGKLDHLAIANTIDFSKLKDFDSSNFNVWKYRIDGDLLRLTFGTEIYDTFSNDEVTGLILEFYDHRGFAGSVEIKNKKSYSGIFNKIITLNSQNEIDNRKIITNAEGALERVSGFVHNAHITKDGDIYKHNEYTVIYDESKGWFNKLISEENPDNSTDLDGFEPPTNSRAQIVNFKLPNDCGTLYSNILYGVKPYFKVKNKTTSKESYIKKDNLFLYTIPFYNDYYYNEDNFNNLGSPELNMVLTYMLDDLSTRSDYNLSDIIKGYYNGKEEGDDTPTDYANYQKYFSTEPMDSQFDIVKYYKYEGTTNLKLEIGLKKEYNNFLISCDPEINGKFLCNLTLNSDDDPGFHLTITSGEYEGQSAKEILNYKSGMNLDLNKIWINDNPDKNSTLNLNIYDYNFKNRQGEKSIKLNYEFVVGYKLNVSDIVLTEVETTVVCALCHKKPNGEYNYEDFGIYITEDGNYLSNCMFYNSGNTTKTEFGIGRLKNFTAGGYNVEYYISFKSLYESTDTFISDNKPLNSGKALESAMPYIGKLLFCQPHIHCIDNQNGVNVRVSINDETIHCITPVYDISTEYESGLTFGTLASHRLYYWPRFTMSLNTRDSIEHYENFISSMLITDSEYVEIPYLKVNPGGIQYTTRSDILCMVYNGASVNDVSNFNKCLIETMKKVYVYNPDYNSISLNKGIVTTQSYNPLFISNVIINDGKFEDGFNLNDYISISGFNFSEYLSDLTTFSLISTSDLQLLQLQPNTTYCGGKGYYLLTSLTYNVPVPNELKYEFEQSSINTIAVKHESGNIELLKGVLGNNKAFYGYDNKKLILLDVSNYEINSSGTLIIKNNTVSNDDIIISEQTSWETYSTLNKKFEYYFIKDDYLSSCLNYSTITINDLLYDFSSEHRLFIKNDRCVKTERKLFYRKVWSYEDDFDVNEHGLDVTKNVLYLYLGPSFKSN